MDRESIENFLRTTAIELAIKILAALAFWIIGRSLIGKVVGLMQAAMNRNDIDPTLTKYLGSIVAIALNIALVLGILGYFGIQTTSFAAMLAGAGLAIGAAWSGMLGNFAAGAFMLVLRPFKVGDFVQVGGITGTVHELGLFGTTLITPDNVMTLVGNGKIFADTVMNYSSRPTRRVERTMQIAGSVDPLDAMSSPCSSPTSSAMSSRCARTATPTTTGRSISTPTKRWCGSRSRPDGPRRRPPPR